MLVYSNLKVPVVWEQSGSSEKELVLGRLAVALKLQSSEIKDLIITKKSVDARKKEQIFFVYTVKFSVDDKVRKRLLAKNIKNLATAGENEVQPVVFNKRAVRKEFLPPVVVGSGPAGMFAGLALAEAGLKPIIIERGKEVSQRAKDVSLFWQKGILDPESNIQFGEGGAGTFSDGKLTTGINDPRCRYILQVFIEAGAPEEIGYLAKPHIGTDYLRKAVENIRKKIIALGGEYRFGHKLTNLKIGNGNLQAITVACGDQTYEMAADHVIMAIGHSARDTFAMLDALKVPMEAKPFSIGVRIEHPQELINKSQYGAWSDHPSLGAAEYKLACHLPDGRSVYSFCMCPGGLVVAAASEPGGVVTNGMSYFSRSGNNANSALLVGVTPADYPGTGPLAGVDFQRIYERLAFELGGGTYAAPVQCVGDFLAARASKSLGRCEPTYRPGVVITDLSRCLPDFAVKSLREAIVILDQKIKGFADSDAVLTGVETRSSSPVRILRNAQCESLIKGLYPCGEGAGYTGGIMSAAADGLRCAEAVLADYII